MRLLRTGRRDQIFSRSPGSGSRQIAPAVLRWRREQPAFSASASSRRVLAISRRRQHSPITRSTSCPSACQSIALQGTGLPSTQSTTTVLWSLLNPSSPGQAVTFVAAILPQVGGQLAGTVTFKDGSATLATVAVSGNAANLTISTLAVGTRLRSPQFTAETEISTAARPRACPR